MASEIENVVMGEFGIHATTLATIGVRTCIAALVLLRGSDIIIVHADPIQIHGTTTSTAGAAKRFIRHCAGKVYEARPNAVVSAVYLIGGDNSRLYRRIAERINALRNSLSLVSYSNQTTTTQLQDFLKNIRLNLVTFNIRKIHAGDNPPGHADDNDDGDNGSDDLHDYITDCIIVYDRMSVPPTFIIAQRAGEEGNLDEDSPITSACIIYNVNVATNAVSATIYPSLFDSPYSSILERMVQSNVTNASLVAAHGLDTCDDHKHKVLLSRVIRRS